MDSPRFGRTVFLIWGGLLTWAAYFLFVYVFAALACARRFADVSVAGLSIVPLATGVATSIALATTVILTRHAERQLRSAAPFARFLAISLGTLAVLCILWVALPVLILRGPC